MAEWRLWEGDEPPAFTTPEFFRGHGYIAPNEQVGHAERTAMAVKLTVGARDRWPWSITGTVLDLGCGDGTFLEALGREPTMANWRLAGTDASQANVDHALALGLDVVLDDFVDGLSSVVGADIIVMNEVLEHLADPHALLRRLTVNAQVLVCTSPLAEDPDWHYEHHAWAWDGQGYADLLRETGWNVVARSEAAADRPVVFPPHGLERVPVSQGLVARRI